MIAASSYCDQQATARLPIFGESINFEHRSVSENFHHAATFTQLAHGREMKFPCQKT